MAMAQASVTYVPLLEALEEIRRAVEGAGGYRVAALLEDGRTDLRVAE
jgi:hypothetical protein